MKSSVFTNVLGLDLGTTNSVVTALIKTGVPEVLESKSGKTTPSCLLFEENGDYIIGKEAYAKRHLPNAVYSFKKYMGTDKKVYHELTARDCSALFVKKLLAEVKELQPQYANFRSVLVSVPAYFDINQVEDTKQAIHAAGYEVFMVEKEPVAAALTYQQIKRVHEDFLVFDLGGGTFDAVLIRNSVGIPKDSREFYKNLKVDLPNIKDILEVLDVSGDNHLGGDNIDELAVEKYLKKYRMKVSEEEYQKLLLLAEKAKKLALDLTPDFTSKPFLYKFVEEATLTVFEKCKAIMLPMLKRAKTFNIHCVLCGGSTKSQIIKDELAKLFPCSYEIDPDLAVAVGDSIKFGITKSSEGYSIVNRLAKGVGVLSAGKIRFLANKGEIIPLHAKFQARNGTPFDTNINIELFQGESALAKCSPVSVVSISDIKGHDKQGYVDVVIDLHITSDSTITVTVTSGDAYVTSELSLSSIEEEISEIQVHPDAKYYHRFIEGAKRYQNEKLQELIENYRLTGETEFASQIMTLLGELAG